jgi:hypothetical protein
MKNRNVMFVNLGFVLNGHTGTTTTVSNLISVDLACQIALFVAQNGYIYNNVNSFAEIIRQKFLIDFSIAKEYIVQLLELRLVAANWMNKNSKIGVDENGIDILNDTIPQTLDELKEDCLYTSSRDFGLYQPIFTVDSLDEAIQQFNYVVDLIVQYSKLDGSGTWDYYKVKVLEHYDYATMQQQIDDARNN